jgi:hypothetical protein
MYPRLLPLSASHLPWNMCMEDDVMSDPQHSRAMAGVSSLCVLLKSTERFKK